ncbi:MAG: MSMEG_0567/Sll0786 family nitrogen starvation N-acetyltransferase [Polyangiales bacterium]
MMAARVEVVVPMFERVLPFLSPNVVVAWAQDPWQLLGSRQLRRQVFCAEQGVFEQDDLDEHDARALTIVALSTVAGMHDRVVGTVRIFETLDPDDATQRAWYGGRLAVAPEYRRHASAGDRLTIAAVATARALGARRFLATVQEANLGFFLRHHFVPLRTLGVQGRPHALMEADLRRFHGADSVLPAVAA